MIPFNTNRGYGVGTGFQDVEERCRDCNILEGFTINTGLEREGIYVDIKVEIREEVRNDIIECLLKIEVH